MVVVGFFVPESFRYDLSALMWVVYCDFEEIGLWLEMCLSAYLWSVAFDDVFFPDVLIVEELGLSLMLSFTCVGVNVLYVLHFFF